MWCKLLLNTCISIIIHKSHTDKTDRGKLMDGYMRRLKCLSDYEKNHTPILYGGFYVTAFRRTRQGFSSLSPNYNPADHYISYRVLLHYSKGKKLNAFLLLLPHSASGLTNDLTDPCQPPDRGGDRRKVSLCTCAEVWISCCHSKQHSKRTDYATVTQLCNCNSIMQSINYQLNIFWDYNGFLEEK